LFVGAKLFNSDTDIRFLLSDNTQLADDEFLQSLESGTLIYCAMTGEALEGAVVYLLFFNQKYLKK